jgi:hypothetical protein
MKPHGQRPARRSLRTIGAAASADLLGRIIAAEVRAVLCVPNSLDRHGPRAYPPNGQCLPTHDLDPGRKGLRPR